MIPMAETGDDVWPSRTRYDDRFDISNHFGRSLSIGVLVKGYQGLRSRNDDSVYEQGDSVYEKGTQTSRIQRRWCEMSHEIGRPGQSTVVASSTNDVAGVRVCDMF